MVANLSQISHQLAPPPELRPPCRGELPQPVMHNASWMPIFLARYAISLTFSVE